MLATAPEFWPASGYAWLDVDEHGWLRPTPGYWRHWLARPELALVADSWAPTTPHVTGPKRQAPNSAAALRWT